MRLGGCWRVLKGRPMKIKMAGRLKTEHTLKLVSYHGEVTISHETVIITELKHSPSRDDVINSYNCYH